MPVQFGGVTVRDVMDTRALGVPPGAAAEVALRLMSEGRLRHLPVIEDGRCVGVLHEADVLWHLWGSGNRDTTVEDLMRAPLPSVTGDDGVQLAAALMAGAHTDAVVVTDHGRMAGLLTAVDLLQVMAR